MPVSVETMANRDHRQDRAGVPVLVRVAEPVEAVEPA